MKALSDCLAERRPLRRLIQQGQQLNLLQAYLEACLAPEYRPHCRIAKYADRTLIIYVAHAALLTLLRFQSQELIKQLAIQPVFQHLKRIDWRIKAYPELS